MLADVNRWVGVVIGAVVVGSERHEDVSEVDVAMAAPGSVRVAAEHWRRWGSKRHALEVEGRETLADLNACVAGALDELFADLVGGGVAVVFTCHAIVRAAAWALGTGLEVSRHVEVANCSITTVGVRRLVRPNENAHLEGLALEP